MTLCIVQVSDAVIYSSISAARRCRAIPGTPSRAWNRARTPSSSLTSPWQIPEAHERCATRYFARDRSAAASAECTVHRMDTNFLWALVFGNTSSNVYFFQPWKRATRVLASCTSLSLCVSCEIDLPHVGLHFGFTGSPHCSID